MSAASFEELIYATSKSKKENQYLYWKCSHSTLCTYQIYLPD